MKAALKSLQTSCDVKPYSLKGHTILATERTTLTYHVGSGFVQVLDDGRETIIPMAAVAAMTPASPVDSSIILEEKSPTKQGAKNA